MNSFMLSINSFWNYFLTQCGSVFFLISKQCVSGVVITIIGAELSGLFLERAVLHHFQGM